MTTPHPDDVPQGRTGVATNASDASVVLHEERLVVETQREAVGRVTLVKRIVEEEHTFTVTLRREEVDVVEETVDAATPAGDMTTATAPTASAEPNEDVRAAANPGTGEIVLYAERPVVSTEWVPVERVRLTRSTTSDVETVTQDVAHEVAEIVGEKNTRA